MKHSESAPVESCQKLMDETPENNPNGLRNVNSSQTDPGCPYHERLFDMTRYSKTSRLTTAFPSVTLFHESGHSPSRSYSTISMKSDTLHFYCNWYPVLFGIDEDDIPISEEEYEGEFEEEETGRMPTTSELVLFRTASKDNLTDEELIQLWRKENRPKYGRRARAKPVLQKPDGTFYDCSCETDVRFQRHHVSRFGGGNPEEKENWRTPHFALFWQDLKDREAGKEDDDAWLAELEMGKLKPEAQEEKIPYIRPTPKFELGKRNQRQLRERILASLRPLDCREIRRFRMLYWEAILLELQEDGYLETAEFFKSVMTAKESTKSFKKNEVVINKMVNVLKECERRGRKSEKNKQAVIYIKLAKFFDEDKSFWWLVEKFYKKAVEVSSKFVIDGSRAEAVSRYAFGIFLLDNLGKITEAREHLSKARELSKGNDWNASTILNTPQDSVYKECSNYLCRALIATGKQMRDSGKAEASLPLIHQAYKLAEESRTSKIEIRIETIFELGMTYHAVGMLDWAKIAFRKFISMAKAEGYIRPVCDGYLQLAICYRSEENLTECQEALKMYLEIATVHNDKICQAFGNRFLGEFNLNNGNSQEAAEYLEKSFHLFLEQYEELPNKPFNEWEPEDFSLPRDVELARCLTGLARGQQITRQICTLILEGNDEDILKLLQWKNGEEITIDEDIPSQIESFTLSQILQASTTSSLITGERSKSVTFSEDNKRHSIVSEEKSVRFLLD